VWIGPDVGKEGHYAEVLNNDGDPLSNRSVAKDVQDLGALLETASQHGAAWLVIDQPGSIAQLAIAVAPRRQRLGSTPLTIRATPSSVTLKPT
jgi:Transposase